MGVFQRILVPTDFGDAAQEALDLALTLAAKLDAEVIVLHASWLAPDAVGAYAEGIEWPTEEMARGAKRALDAAVAAARGGHPRTEGLFVTGEPWREILQTAKQRGIDLIVMGTHGRRGLARALLGSVAEKVVRLSPIPVLTIAATPEPALDEA